MPSLPPPILREPWFLRFRDLMPFRVREILLVSSAYDAFIMEGDGRLDERLFTQFSELGLTASPRITHVTGAAAALEMLASREFHLVITVVRLEDSDAAGLATAIEAQHPAIPVVLLTFDEADLMQFPGGALPRGLDGAFLWTGDAAILSAAIKLIEDAANADHDTRAAGVQVIIVVEDSIRRYSAFLALLYAELMKQSQSLIAEGLNNLHRLMRMRGRPKILLARTFEEAVDTFRRYQDHVMAVISDVRFPRGGAEDAEAGFRLLELVRAATMDVPVLLQSAEPELAPRVTALGVWHADKNSPSLNAEIGAFLRDALGFGDFVFRLPDRREVGRARDLFELEAALRTVPAESLAYHASRNHFSMWLNARSMFALAQRLRPRQVSEFADLEELRRYLAGVLHAELATDQQGVIADLQGFHGPDQRFVRISQGSVGGKGRGIAFINHMLARNELYERFDGLDIRIPKTVVVGTDEFDRFLEQNQLSLASIEGADDVERLATFVSGHLHPDFRRDLEVTFRDLSGPVAVRSSSLLEDSRFQPFAGIYATVMLPNDHPDPAVRFAELCRAIKSVYASTFSSDARSYFAGLPHSMADEKMAVVLQEVVGRHHGPRFYPHISGVAQSHNYYPVGLQRAEDGIALLALGLGHAVVAGGAAMRFSPATPEVLPQFPTARHFLRYSQSSFYALDTSRSLVDLQSNRAGSVIVCDLAAAEQDGTLSLVGSTYCPEDDVIRDTFTVPGPRVVTFNNILKWHTIPLARALRELLTIFRQGMGGDVEIEFAVDLGALPDPVACLYVLQVRPMARPPVFGDPGADEPIAEQDVLARTGRALGHGRIDDLRDVVYVRRTAFDHGSSRRIAAEVGNINRELLAEGRPYLLIGPGRWGTTDPSLGIPVAWSQISGVRAIVETSIDGRVVEPSQGTHFFQNVTAMRIGYLTIDDTGASEDERLDADWLDAQPAAHETVAVRHVHLAEPLLARLDGRRGTATIAKPRPPVPEDDEPPG